MEFDLYADPDVTLVDDLDEKAFTFTAVSRSYKDLEFSDDKDALSPIPSDGYLYRVSEDTNTNRIIAAFEDDEIEMPEDFTLKLGDCFTATQPSTHTVYTVEITAGKQKYRIFQRYSEFYKFDQQLRKEVEKQQRSDLPPLPILPPKDFVNKNDPAFIEGRKQQLERYLKLLVIHPYISRGKKAKEIAEKLLSILPGSVQSHISYKLLGDLKKSIQVLLDATAGQPDIIIEDGEPAFRLCFNLEKILHHGLKGGQAIFNRKCFWKYVVHLPECINDTQIKEQLELAREMGKNDLARARILLRLLLNEKCLSQCLEALFDNRVLTEKSYEDFALIRNEEHRFAFLMLLHMLGATQFTLWIKEENLGEWNYYAQILRSRQNTSLPTVVNAPPSPKPLKAVNKVAQSSAPFIPPTLSNASRLSRRSISTEKHVGEDAEYTPSSPSVGEQLTASLWSIVCISLVKEEKKDGVYADLVTQSSSFDEQISSDIHRVLTTVRFESGDGPKLLHNIVKAFTLYKPELGYSQELSFIAAVLLLQLEEEGAFWVLCWLSKKYSYEERYLFAQDPTLLKHSLYILARLIEKKIPEVGKCLSEMGVSPSFFASEWFSTLFAYGFPISTTFRIWDVLFLEEKEYLFRISLAMIFLAKDKLNSFDSMEQIVQYMKKEMPKTLDIDRILKVAEDITIPNDVFNFYNSSFVASNSTNPFIDE